MSKSPPSAKRSAGGDEAALHARIHALVLAARQTVARGVDLVQVRTNFEIGRHIVEHEQQGQARAGYGKDVLKNLAQVLTVEFGSGFSLTNLKLMRQFYLQNVDRMGQTSSDLSVPAAIGQTLSDQSSAFRLSWSHCVFLLGIRNPDERGFYEIEAADQSWTVRELKRQFDSGLFERLALSRDKEGIRALARQGQLVTAPADLLKEPLVLEFLGLSEQAGVLRVRPGSRGHQPDRAVPARTRQGLPVRGAAKALHLRRRSLLRGPGLLQPLLRCYVLIDLKLGKLTHQDLGQMQMYVNYFDRFVKAEGENATMGIVLCKKKNEALVEITLPADANIHAREYQLYLPSKEELQRKLQEWVGRGWANEVVRKS